MIYADDDGDTDDDIENDELSPRLKNDARSWFHFFRHFLSKLLKVNL